MIEIPTEVFHRKANGKEKVEKSNKNFTISQPTIKLARPRKKKSLAKVFNNLICVLFSLLLKSKFATGHKNEADDKNLFILDKNVLFQGEILKFIKYQKNDFYSRKERRIECMKSLNLSGAERGFRPTAERRTENNYRIIDRNDETHCK